MAGSAIKLIAGLGNPGTKYDGTRHNAGFWFVDELARRYNGIFKVESRFSGECCKIDIAGSTVWLLKPSTFMNRSGLSVKQLSSFFKISPNEILIAHDELDILPGTVRLKNGGGHGGHNGLRDLHAQIGKDYWRLRLGIGHPGDAKKVADYVLSRPSASDEIEIRRTIDDAADEIERIVIGDMQKVMNTLHTK
ncbi:aminoacyl-tRNA hydrolase [Leucothrix pacifica]|uniref:aminoacyl-tRNA hydrolase n=1 Tax=Leucothrix pacifica TaxID=1247513 RepID=UPI001C644B42|nr:aminoacyl-tRNA hydrolase [Leucothrix pacifica]